MREIKALAGVGMGIIASTGAIMMLGAGPFLLVPLNLFGAYILLVSKVNYSLFMEREKTEAYFTNSRLINVNHSQKEVLVPVIAHEYTHHLQAEAGFNGEPLLQSFKEGHARGVELIVANGIYSRTGKAQYLVKPVERSTADLMASYALCSARLHIAPSKAIFKAYGSIESEEHLLMASIGEPTAYAIGHGAFTAKSKISGKDAYKDALSGALEF
jgi:hypothetical protein